MKSVQKIDLGLTGYDELFMNDAERKENKLPRMQVDSMFPVTLISLFLKSLSSSMTLPTIRKTTPTSEMTLKKCRISSLRTSILRSSWKLKMTMRWTATMSSSRRKTS